MRVSQDTIAAGRIGADAAVARLIGQLDDFDHAILSALPSSLDPVSQRVIAEHLGVHPVSVHRNVPRAQARFAELLTDPAHQEVVELAQEVRRRLGPYIPADVVGVELRCLGVEPSGRSAEVLLHVAGPYGRCGTWVQNCKEGGGGRAQAAAAVDAVFAGEAAPSTASLLQALVDLGMPAVIALIYLEKHSALRRFGDVWVRWAGDTAANRAEAALHVLGAAATAEAILATFNSDSGTSLKRVNAVLSLDDRFVRASFAWSGQSSQSDQLFVVT